MALHPFPKYSHLNGAGKEFDMSDEVSLLLLFREWDKWGIAVSYYPTIIAVQNNLMMRDVSVEEAACIISTVSKAPRSLPR
jgi:hypothetical protein